MQHLIYFASFIFLSPQKRNLQQNSVWEIYGSLERFYVNLLCAEKLKFDVKISENQVNV